MKHKALTLAFLLLAVPAWAQQDWQVRGLCDLRKNAGEARADACAQSASEVLMLLPEKAGPGDLAVVAELTDNLAKAGVGWEAPCRDASHCPETAYTLRYAMVSRKVATIAKEKVFTALICREGFSETPQDASACRRKLLKVVGELAARARKENALLAVLKQCYLARDQEIEGIPCMNGGFFGDGRRGGAQFHENGKLASCTLSKDFGGLRRGARYLQAP